MCTNTATGWRMPPVLYISCSELAAGTKKKVFPDKMRSNVSEGHGVLQLIPEAEGASRLIISTASPHPAGQCLIHKPSVSQYIYRVIRSFHLYRSKCVHPELIYCIKG